MTLSHPRERRIVALWLAAVPFTVATFTVGSWWTVAGSYLCITLAIGLMIRGIRRQCRYEVIRFNRWMRDTANRKPLPRPSTLFAEVWDRR